MVSGIFNTLVYTPLYNGLIFLLDLLPSIDAGIAVVLFTCIIKLILFPLSRKSLEVQMGMRSTQTEVDQIKIKHKDNREEQARQIMAVYKNKGINPLSGIILIIIQIPIIIGLYLVFYRSGLPMINQDLLYSFVKTPEAVSMMFFGLIDISQKSLVLALAAGITQFFQVRMAMPAPVQQKNGERSFKDDLAKSLNLQMRYVMPVLVFFFSWQLPAVIPIYWATSNPFAIGQEIYIRRGRDQA